MHDETRHVVLPSGRTVAYAEYGAPSGRPALYFHGGLSSRVDARCAAAACRAAGVRLIALDRPGIGGSSPCPNRTLLDWPDDVRAVLDALAIDTADVIGWSGGGPYALACALKIPARIGAVVTVGGMIPIDQPGRSGELGLAADRLLFPLARRAPWVAAAALRATKLLGRGMFKRSALASLHSPADRRLVARWSPQDATDFFFEALRPGAQGTVTDFRILGSTWGFQLEDVAKPVHVVQGEEDDLLPRAHAEELARRLPRGRLWVVPDTGHYAFHAKPETVLALLKA